MRIEVDTGKDDKKKETTREVLLIGKRIPAGPKQEEQYYARLLADEGVFRINAKLLEPLKEAVQEPTRIRSKDVVVFDAKKADAIVITTTRTQKDKEGKDTPVKEEVKL